MWVLISVRCTGGVDHFRLMVKRSFVVTCETGAMVDLCSDGILSYVLVANYLFFLVTTNVLNYAVQKY